jgi:hypothetical protein
MLIRTVPPLRMNPGYLGILYHFAYLSQSEIMSKLRRYIVSLCLLYLWYRKRATNDDSSVEGLLRAPSCPRSVPRFLFEDPLCVVFWPWGGWVAEVL